MKKVFSVLWHYIRCALILFFLFYIITLAFSGGAQAEEEEPYMTFESERDFDSYLENYFEESYEAERGDDWSAYYDYDPEGEYDRGYYDGLDEGYIEGYDAGYADAMAGKAHQGDW